MGHGLIRSRVHRVWEGEGVCVGGGGGGGHSYLSLLVPVAR